MNPCHCRALTVCALVLSLGLAGPVLAGDGEPDPSFGQDLNFDGVPDGITVINMVTNAQGNSLELGLALVVQPDGKPIVGGQVLVFGPMFSSTTEVGLARLRTDGTLDPTFGTGGKTMAFPTSTSEGLLLGALALQSDGKIVGCGNITRTTAPFASFAVFRFHADGSLDTTFGTGGDVNNDMMDEMGITVTPNTGSGFAIAVDAQDRILCGGGLNFTVARYTPDGHLDTTFATNGLFTINFGFGGAEVKDLLVQPDGKYVAVGDDGGGGYAVLRLNDDGTPDTTTFNPPQGWVNSQVFVGQSWDAALQPNGSIVVTGETNASDYGFMRVTSAGDLDSTFDGDGVSTLDLGDPRDEGRAVMIDSEGRILAAGRTWAPTGEDEISVVRLLPDGTPDPDLGGDGDTRTDVYGFEDYARAGALDHNTYRLLVAGDAETPTDVGFFVARFETGDSGSPGVDSDVAICGTTGHYVWVDRSQGNANVRYRRCPVTSGAASCTGSVPLVQHPSDQEHPTVTCSAGNSTVIVAWEDHRNGNTDIAYRRSTSNGDSFDPMTFLVRAPGDEENPQLAMSGDDVMAVWEDDRNGNIDLAFRRSTNGGSNFLPLGFLVRSPLDDTEPSLAMNGTRAIVAWVDLRRGSYDIAARHSTTSGASWAGMKFIVAAPGIEVQPSVGLNSLGLTVVSWTDTRYGSDDIAYRRSIDTGTSYEALRFLVRAPTDDWNPQVAVDDQDVLILWVESRSGNLDLSYRISANAANLFALPMRLVSARTNETGPACALVGTGVACAWTDRRGGMTRPFARQSDDTGQNWGTLFPLQ